MSGIVSATHELHGFPGFDVPPLRASYDYQKEQKNVNGFCHCLMEYLLVTIRWAVSCNWILTSITQQRHVVMRWEFKGKTFRSISSRLDLSVIWQLTELRKWAELICWLEDLHVRNWVLSTPKQKVYLVRCMSDDWCLFPVHYIGSMFWISLCRLNRLWSSVFWLCSNHELYTTSQQHGYKFFWLFENTNKMREVDLNIINQ